MFKFRRSISFNLRKKGEVRVQQHFCLQLSSSNICFTIYGNPQNIITNISVTEYQGLWPVLWSYTHWKLNINKGNGSTGQKPVKLKRNDDSETLCENVLKKNLQGPLSFYASWKHLKTSTFLMFSGDIDRNNFYDISYVIAKWFERLDPALNWKF